MDRNLWLAIVAIDAYIRGDLARLKNLYFSESTAP